MRHMGNSGKFAIGAFLAAVGAAGPDRHHAGRAGVRVVPGGLPRRLRRLRRGGGGPAPAPDPGRQRVGSILFIAFGIAFLRSGGWRSTPIRMPCPRAWTPTIRTSTSTSPPPPAPPPCCCCSPGPSCRQGPAAARRQPAPQRGAAGRSARPAAGRPPARRHPARRRPRRRAAAPRAATPLRPAGRRDAPERARHASVRRPGPPAADGRRRRPTAARSGRQGAGRGQVTGQPGQVRRPSRPPPVAEVARSGRGSRR